MADQPAAAWPFYARDGLHTETYDQRTAADAAGVLDGDIDFYLGLAEQTGGPVLDLGGGTGRVAWPQAEAGFEVTLVDRSSPMLRLAESKGPDRSEEVRGRVRFLQADMTALDQPGWENTFGLAVIPFRAFQAILEPDQQRACLGSVRRYLRPGGLLAFHVFEPNLAFLVPDAPPPSLQRSDVVHPRTGRPVTTRVIARQTDPFRQVFRETWEFTELAEDGSALRREHETLEMRWTYRYEMRHLLELSGFSIEGHFGDFRGGEPGYLREQVWVCRKPV